MLSLGQDLKFALRSLRRAPVVTLAALATLALGIGANAAIFSVIYGVLGSPLSAPDAHRLMAVPDRTPERPFLWASYENFRDRREQTLTFEDLALLRPQSVNVTGGGESPERIRGMFVSASFFSVLGEPLAHGRPILEGEDVPNGERTVVLSHGFWQRRWGGDPDALGETVLLNNEIHTIVGVMSPNFRFPMDTTEAWISLQTSPGELDRGRHNFFVFGRLADRVTAADAAEEMRRISTRLAEAHPELNRDRSSWVLPLKEVLVRSRSEQLLLILLAAVAMVLLIGAANVANLQLARATGRGREMAIRAALGGHRAALIRQLLTESLVLALAGGALGLAVAKAGVSLLEHLNPSWLGALFTVEINLYVLAFLAVVSVATGILFGLVPALRASRTDLTESLRDGGRAQSSGARGGRLRGALVVAQMTLAVMLLIGAGLLMRSLVELQRVDVGFERDQLLTLQFRLPANKYAEDEQIVQFFDHMLERIAAIPGVVGVASALDMPFTGDGGQAPVLKDGVEPGEDVQVPVLGVNRISANFFEILGIPIRSGRPFSAADRAGTVPVAILSEQAAEQLWPGEAPIGKSFRIRTDPDGPLIQVVGVAGDIYSRGLEGDVYPAVYLPYAQAPSRFATIALRVIGEPMTYAPAARAAIWKIDPDQPLWEVMTQNTRIGFWTSEQRFTSSLLAVFAVIALALAAIGIAGVLAYTVSQRTHEIGIRLALGAGRAQIQAMVLKTGLLYLLTGVVLGLTGAALLSRALAGVLFGVGAIDPWTFALAPALLAAAALLACYLPARKASRVDPLVALRYE